MKRSILVIAIVALAVFAISGCQVIVGIILNPDLTVENIEVDTDAAGEITGITVTFYNYGGAVEGVEYAIYLSADDNINTASDYKVYEGDIDIEWRQTQQVDVSMAQMEAFVATQATPPPEGQDYYIGVFIDPDNRVEEGDETDNEDSVSTAAQFGSIPEDTYESDPADEMREILWSETGDFYADEEHTFHSTSGDPDADWFYIYVPAGYVFDVYTYSLGNGLDVDTVIDAYYWDDSGSEWLYLDSDDDSGTDYYSWLEAAEPTGSGTWMAAGIYEYDGLAGEYGLEIWVYLPIPE